MYSHDSHRAGYSGVMGLSELRTLVTGTLVLTFVHSTQSSIPSVSVNADPDVRPNVVFVLTDDQDVYLGGVTPMRKTKRLIGDEGIIFNNMFVTSPLCCPSRSSIVTGKYIHNHHTVNNSVSGGCSSPSWQEGPEKRAFSTYIKQAQYNTFFAGKYLNQYGKKNVGGVQHVPPGWDWWTGLVGNSVYYDYRLSVNGTQEKHGHVYSKDYLTDVIHDRALDFLSYQTTSTPFFMMLSTPACHAPFTPAPQYKSNFSDLRAPRTPNYDINGKDKHWLIRAAPTPMSAISVKTSDSVFRNRWRTLLSVDDMVESLVMTLYKRGLLNNTYIVFSSDNGFHLGQFSLPVDKRQLYEFDVRVPLMVRGPGIKPGQVREEAVLNIDLAPTFLDLTGTGPASDMDGISFKSLLLSDGQTDGRPVRNTFLLEYYGESRVDIPGCPWLHNQSVANCQPDCVCEDAKNNTFHCLRTIDTVKNRKYCELDDKEHFVELYDLQSDPDELTNLAREVTPGVQKYNSMMLEILSQCKAETCNFGRGVVFA